MPLLWSGLVSLWPLTSKECICGTLLLQRREHEIGTWETELFQWNWTRRYRIVCRDTSFQKSTDLYVHGTEGTERKKKKGTALWEITDPGNCCEKGSLKWVGIIKRAGRYLKADLSTWLFIFINPMTNIFCKWSSTGRSWISTELFSTESLGVRAPDYLGRSSRSSWCIKEQEQIVFKDPICSTVRRNQEFNRVTNISKCVFNRKPFESACYTAVKMWLL